eukprot:284815290_4
MYRVENSCMKDAMSQRSAATVVREKSRSDLLQFYFLNFFLVRHFHLSLPQFLKLAEIPSFATFRFVTIRMIDFVIRRQQSIVHTVRAHPVNFFMLSAADSIGTFVSHNL